MEEVLSTKLRVDGVRRDRNVMTKLNYCAHLKCAIIAAVSSTIAIWLVRVVDECDRGKSGS